MSLKRIGIIVAGVVLVATIWGYVWLKGPYGRIIARLQRKDASGFIRSVTVRQFSGRFRTELSDEGQSGHDLLVSSYEFYEGSIPITAASISWPESHKFTVTFNNGDVVDCSWNHASVSWAIK